MLRIVVPLFIAPLVVLQIVSSPITARSIEVQVLNGRNGKPVANEHVNIFRTGDFGDLTGDRNVRGFTTDAAGIVTASEIAPDVRSFVVSVDWHRSCTKAQATFSLQEVLSTGVVGQNACKRIAVQTVKPGTLILFVRDETFLEKMAH